jgi:hypothetical protein
MTDNYWPQDQRDIEAREALQKEAPRDVWEYSFIHSSALGYPDETVGPCLTYDREIAYGKGCFGQRELSVFARPAPEALGAAKGVTPTGAGLHAMELLGGSFVKSLAASYYAADVENKRKLIDAFAEYFDRYEAIAKQKGIEA